LSARIQVKEQARGAAAAGRTEAQRLRLVAVGAAAAAVVTRAPFTAGRLWDHDSVQFALGVERYDLAAHHPHPPGYPLYIAALKLLAMFGVDSLHGMVALSILAAALGAWLIVPLTARLASTAANGSAPGASGAGTSSAPATAAVPAAALAAALYVFNPLLWFYGELPLVYAVEGGMTVGLAYAALRMADGRGPFLAACAAFALAGGVRPSTLVLLLPLFLLGAWHGWRRGATPGTVAAGAALGTAVGVAWLAPLLTAAGGYAAYRRIGSEHFSSLLPYTSILYGAGWRALAHNLTIMTKWFLEGLVPAVVALGVLWVPVRPRRRARHPRRLAEGAAGLTSDGDSGSGSVDVVAGVRLLAAVWPWLAAWAVPPVLFFALFHVTKAGYTLVYLPALLVAASLLAAPAMGRRRRQRGEIGQADEREEARQRPGLPGPAGWARLADGGGRTAAAILLAAATGAALFLFGADRRPDQPRAWAVVRDEFNRTAIATYERDLDALLAALRRFPPATTVLATVELSGTGPAGPEGFLYPWQRHLQWYLPEYEVLQLVPEDRFALVTRGHQPFHRVGPELELPPDTRQLAIVLSGPTGNRFPLSAWPLRRIGETFYLVVIPISGRLELGPFTLVVPRRQAA